MPAKKNNNLDDVIEIVSFIKDSMATKDDLKDLENRMDQRFDEIQQELKSINDELDYIKAELAKLEKRTREDVDVAGKDVIKYDNM